MRWKALFEDMEAQLEAAEWGEREAEIADRVRRDQGMVTLAERLRGQVGLTLKVGTSGGDLFEGELTHLGSEWLVLNTAAAETLVRLGAVQHVEGLGRRIAGETSRVQAALGLGSALRTLARERRPVAVHRTDGRGRIEGTIDRVGRDFFEIAAVLPGEVRRSTRVTTVYAVPFSGIAAVASR